MDYRITEKLERDLANLLNKVSVNSGTKKEVAKCLIDIMSDDVMDEIIKTLITSYVFWLDKIGK